MRRRGKAKRELEMRPSSRGEDSVASRASKLEYRRCLGENKVVFERESRVTKTVREDETYCSAVELKHVHVP